MGYKCAALNCRSGYDGEAKDSSVSFHAFPLHNKQLLQLWTKRLARKDFVPSKYSRLCSLHFVSEDFVTESNDINNRRKRKRKSATLEKRRLKSDVAPSVFTDLPTYYAFENAPQRSGLSTSSSRHEKEAARLEECCEAFLNADKIDNFNDLITKLSEELGRQKYLIHHVDNGVYLIHLSEQTPPSILATIFINTELEVALFQDQKSIPSSAYHHILPTKKVTLLSHVSNLMAFGKNKKLDQATKEEQFQSKVNDTIFDFLVVTENEQQISFLKFIAEQISLLFTSKHQRRYSTELLMVAYIVFATSSRAYERLMEENVIILPSTKTLRKITLNLSSKSGLDDKQYLRLRYSQLNAFDRNIIIMIDEIYLSKRIESSGGQLFGLTENCQIASTALCFMIKSLSSGYKDMVGIYPMKNLKAAAQKDCFDKIIFLLHEIGFNVIGISVDNAAANRKFYKDFLCAGIWKPFITNQFTGGKIFLIFDPTHIVKNVYNNWLTRKTFKLPSVVSLVPEPLTANFSDVVAVYDEECHKPLRIAHKLSETVLNPKTIEKVNVKLALSVLHESTISALRHYGYSETAAVFKVLVNS